MGGLLGDEIPSVMNPRGPAAAELTVLSWQLFVGGAVVFVITMGFLVWAMRRQPGHRPGTGALVGWGIVIPSLVLAVLMVLAVRTAASTGIPPDDPAVVIEIVGHQFWWEVRYPDDGVVTANEIVIPAGAPVLLRLESADVIHSFWIPQLQGKTDMIPGRVNSMWLQADEPGTYGGVCAEFCGIQHALMRQIVIALPAAEFEQWLLDQAADAAPPQTASAQQGLEVFQQHCMQCHAVRGATPPVDIGPDLTHLATRQTIGAAILPNNRGALGGWILDPQSQKQGVRMPPSDIDGPQLQALLDYLEGLR
ncbi:cytochrome c oxidase subunit II [soil metagenome]